jgi:hypothetical protein
MKPLGIAIAEDNWLVAKYLCGELAALGHAIVGRARTGEELINLVADQRPDLVVADVRLADGSDGLAPAKEIQERFDIPAIPPPDILPLPRPKRRDSWESEQAVYHAGFASDPRRGGRMAGERFEQTLPEALIPAARPIHHVERRESRTA